jgi:large subunit ribosomal protein L25
MKLEIRQEKGASVRKKGFVPGVIYGKKLDPIAVKLEAKAFLKTLKEFGKNMVFDVELEGTKHQVYVKNYQINPIRNSEFFSFDLQKVSASDTMTTEIPLNIIGREAFEAKKLLVQQILNAVECEYPVGQGVQSFDVDITSLKEGDALYVKDLPLPKGFKAITELDAMVVNISVPSFKEESTEEAIDGDDALAEGSEKEEE